MLAEQRGRLEPVLTRCLQHEAAGHTPSSSRLGVRGGRERPVAPNTHTHTNLRDPRGPPTTAKAGLPHLPTSATQLTTGL